MTASATYTAKFAPGADPSVETVPLNVWTASTAYVVGNIVRSANGSGNYYACTVAGTSGSSAPTWTTVGQTVSDNGITWQDIGTGLPGDLVTRPNGMAAYIMGLEPLSLQRVVSFGYRGCGPMKKASGTTCADGAAIWFDSATGLGVTSSPTYGFYVGVARGAWVSGVTTGNVVINGVLASSTFAGTSLTLSGALVAQSTLAVTGAATLSSTLAVTGAITATGGIVMGATLKLTASNTPVAAAGSTYSNATAVGAQDIITISSDSAAKGVKLLTGVAGQRKVIINTTATACNLYAATGGTLSGLSANAPVTIAASHIVVCICVAADTWYVEDAGAILAA